MRGRGDRRDPRRRYGLVSTWQSHWEGATPGQAMTYVAIHEGTVEFKEKVTDQEYRKMA